MPGKDFTYARVLGDALHAQVLLQLHKEVDEEQKSMRNLQYYSRLDMLRHCFSLRL